MLGIMKFYAVRRGSKPGIYTSKKEFKESIEGYDKPEYGIFKTEKDAEMYLAKYMRLRNEKSE